jgi:hypothetical protein
VSEPGLLERPAVLLRPADAAALRPITCADTGQPLGFARRPPRPKRPWWRRLTAPPLAVHEQEDEPLVFTVRRPWALSSRREVRDAESNPIGSVRGSRVENIYGRTLAVLGPADASGERIFRTPGGYELARLTPAADGLRLSFTPGVEDPFLRMLLLAAALGEAG